jgi:hypothetical protein
MGRSCSPCTHIITPTILSSVFSLLWLSEANERIGISELGVSYGLGFGVWDETCPDVKYK